MRLTVSGTPAAVVVELPNEERMSWRTMPESSRTSAPLLPSPGYGPAVSSGTTESTVSTAPAALDAVAPVLALVVAVDAAADVPAVEVRPRSRRGRPALRR